MESQGPEFLERVWGSASKNKARANLRGPTAVRTVCEPSGINPMAQTKEWVWREGSSV